MIISLPRKKKASYLLKLAYLIKTYLPLSSRLKARVFSDLEWVFSRIAFELSFSVYDHATHPLRSNKFLLTKLTGISSILDIGCGNGELAAQMYDYCNNITGIDISWQAIAVAKERFPWITFIHGSAESISLGRYDLVVLSHVLEHLDDPAPILSAVKDVSKFLYIEVPDFDSSVLNQLRLDTGSNLLYTDSDHVSEFTREDLYELLLHSGITVLDFESRHGFLKFWCSLD